MRTVGHVDSPEVDLHVTNLCPALCDHCIYESSATFSDELTLAEIIELLSQLRDLGAEEVHLTGGEPLLRSDLFEIIDFGRSVGLHFRMQTNGLLLASHARRLFSLGIRDVLVSIDGPAEYHDNVRGIYGLYAAAESGILACVALGMDVRVNTVVRRSNRAFLGCLFKRTGLLGARQHSFFYLSGAGRVRQSAEVLTIPEYMDWAREFVSMIPRSERKRFACQAAGCLQSEDPLECRIEQRDNILIMANGDVYPCVLLFPSKMSLGNVRNSSIQVIWHSAAKWNAIRRLKEKLASKASCQNCRGGCLGASIYLSSDSCDPRCQPGQPYKPGCIRQYMVCSEKGGITHLALR